MAQFIPGVTATSPAPRSGDLLTDLNLLLSRLQRTILHADAEREARLKESEFERAKAQTNINHARSLLTRIEQETLSVKIHTHRQSIQTDLVHKRELLDRLSERLSDLAEFAAASTPDEDDDGDTSEGEDILADIIATPSESLESSPPDPPADNEADSSAIDTPPSPAVAPIKESTPKPATNAVSKPSPPPQISTTETSQSLRPRRHDTPSSSSQKPSATTTSSSHSALLGDRKDQPITAVSSISAVATKEAILDHQRAEQDALSESILKLASQLKASSQAFSASLEEDLELVNRAGEGMSKSEARMDTITKRMGSLTRMTEGEGWWGRMRLYAIVYGLMVVLVLVVFVLPKLRF